jgi:hypothetical protein
MAQTVTAKKKHDDGRSEESQENPPSVSSMPLLPDTAADWGAEELRCRYSVCCIRVIARTCYTCCTAVRGLQRFGEHTVSIFRAEVKFLEVNILHRIKRRTWLRENYQQESRYEEQMV